MRALLTAALMATILGLSATGAQAFHGPDCTPGEADPDTYTVVDLTPVGSGLFYVEERGVPPPANAAPLPGSGFLLGDGTWVYREANGLPGLQRMVPDDVDCTPIGPTNCLLWHGCLQCFSPIEEACGHGPDTLIGWLW